MGHLKVKAVDLAGGQAFGPAVWPLMRSRHGPGAAGHTGHCPQPAHTGLGSDRPYRWPDSASLQ